MANVSTLNVTTQSDMNFWRPYIWSARVYEEAKEAMYWERFTGGEGSGMPVVRKTELITVGSGQRINISQVRHLTGAGRTGSQKLKGNEEKLNLRQVYLEPTWYRHAVAADIPGMKQINQAFREKAQAGLGYWMADKMDASMWTAATTKNACGFEAMAISEVFAGNATARDELDASDDFDVAVIRKAAALLRGQNIRGVTVPGLPANAGGFYLLFIHPYQAYSLKNDDEWKDNHYYAHERGLDNPIFTGSLGIVDGVVVYETTQCSRTANSASPSIMTANAVMVGIEALARGMNEEIVWSEEIEDYEFDLGIGIRAAWEDKVLSSNAIKHVESACIAPS